MVAFHSSSSRFDVGIIVADIDLMCAFYADVLGLPVIGDRTVASGTRIVTLGAGESHLKLNRPEPVPTRRPHDGAHRDALGLRYVTVYVTDARAAHKALAELGHAPTGPVRMTPSGSVFFLTDPEGNTVEVAQPS